MISVYAVGAVSGEKFCDALDRYITKSGMKATDIAYSAGITASELSKYRHGKVIPRLLRVIELCFVLRLTYPRSEYLIHKAGYMLSDNEEHCFFKKFLLDIR